MRRRRWTAPLTLVVKTLLDDLTPREPKAASADPRRYVDPTLVQEVEATGFVKQLYKR